ncbi:hypothetical protein [Azoarcus olearius]|uniref:hypothetical protein n=1 Tax=Azoarcus sp. (strain BH72) TaxID=418699 RepID=UPI0011D17E9D|nr:hypothetical protein [Azoarcus olearius]
MESVVGALARAPETAGIYEAHDSAIAFNNDDDPLYAWVVGRILRHVAQFIYGVCVIVASDDFEPNKRSRSIGIDVRERAIFPSSHTVDLPNKGWRERA